MVSLAARAAWVTGAGSGIGRAIAVGLGEAGMRVGLTGRTLSALEDTAGLVRAAGGEAVVAVADVTDPTKLAAAHQAVVAAFGDVFLLVNNAGWNTQARHWRELSVATVKTMIATNLSAPFYAVLLVLPAMRAAGDGVVVNIASLAGTSLFLPAGPAYIAAKHGARAMSATLNAEEGLHGIRSICINPGEVTTAIMDKRPVPPSDEARARMVQPEDVARMVVFCAGLPARTCVADVVIVPTDNVAHRAEATALARA